MEHGHRLLHLPSPPLFLKPSVHGRNRHTGTRSLNSDLRTQEENFVLIIIVTKDS